MIFQRLDVDVLNIENETNHQMYNTFWLMKCIIYAYTHIFVFNCRKQKKKQLRLWLLQNIIILAIINCRHYYVIFFQLFLALEKKLRCNRIQKFMVSYRTDHREERLL